MNADNPNEVDPTVPCRCGSASHFAGRRSEQFQSVLGPLRFQGANCHCPGCGHSSCPRDQHLGIENTSLPPARTRLAGTVGALVIFRQDGALLQELAGMPIDAKQVERTAERLGEERAVDERGPREPGKTAPLPQTLSQGIEGTGIPLLAEELAGVADKRPHGSAETREAKIGTIWSAEPFEEHRIPMRDEGSVTYSAALESAATRDTAVRRSLFAQRVWREASRRRFCQAPRTAVLGDGAAGIWNIASDQFPEAVQMVDRFHAQKHRSDLGKSFYGPTDSRPAP